MLQSIHIQNYALIESLDIDFHSGFSVITGETGAGKSIILGAIGLLVGQRADMKAIKAGTNKCIVEAHFDISSYHLEQFFEENELEYENGVCILRRELHISGKSRSFINDSPVSLSQLKEIGEKLIDVHSQHQNLLLNHEDFQLSILDILAHNEENLITYKNLYGSYKDVSKQLVELTTLSKKNREEEDYIRFQVEQLEEAQLKDGEQEELEQEAETLSHAEDIKAGLYKIVQLIDSDDMTLLSIIKDCIYTLQGISKVYTPAEDWINRLDSCFIELKDLLHEISNAGEKVAYNPTRLDFVNHRLNLIYALQQKHRVSSVEELISLTADYREKLDKINSSEERIQELVVQKDNLYKKLLFQAEKLTSSRKCAALEIEQRIKDYLIPLGMPNVRFSIDFSNREEPDSNGMNRVTFLFSANKNAILQNVATIASGGEISRVMLSLKAMIAGAVKLPTIIFDEIDTGVSGSIAEKMALIMQEMGQANRQVISITHLPQIAAKGKMHYKVYKEDTEVGTNSYICQLSQEERIYEIANMLSGATLTEAALNNAKALLNNEVI